MEFGPFKHEFISNRGTKVWPGQVSPDLLMMKLYRCWFMATKDIQDACDQIPEKEQPKSGGGQRCRIYGIMMVRRGTVRSTKDSAFRQIRAETEPGKRLRHRAGDFTIHHPGLPTQNRFKEPNASRVDALKVRIFLRSQHNR